MSQKIYLVPGPVRPPKKVLDVYQQNFGSSDLEPDFFDLYANTEKLLQSILRTKNSIVMMTGEAMLGLWSGLKSCLQPNDKVLAIANGLFGDGIAEMAKNIGADVKTLNFPYNQAVADFDAIETAIETFKPKMITAVHCETPTGVVNPIEKIGALKKKYQIPLLYVDAVASIGGMPVEIDDWSIDICLGGSQKALSSLADITFIAVSDAAWKIISNVNYHGYDALRSFQSAVNSRHFPYTQHWHGIAALNSAVQLILNEGLENVHSRHQKVSAYCHEQTLTAGLNLFPLNLSYAAPTVTAIYVPSFISWKNLDAALRARGVIFGGNYGILSNKVFRIGHMGVQADLELVRQGMEALREVCC